MRSKKLQFVLCVVAWSTILWLHENYEFVPRRSVPLSRQPELRGGALSASHAQPLTREDAVAIDVDVEPEKVVRKSAFLAGMKPGSSFWMHCSNQRGTCACDGTIRWGRCGPGGVWKEYPQPMPGVQHNLSCSVDVLPDLLPGDDGKHCECETVVGGSFYNSITNPGLLPESAHAADSPLLVSSCEIVEAMTRRHPPPTGNVTSPSAWDRALWESVEPFCDPGWPESEAARREPGGAASGSAAIAMPALRSSVLSWVDEAFVGAQARLYDEDGWLPRGFMTYFAGPPTGKHAKMVEMLITSVHEFSNEPIVVVHFGGSAPAGWTPKRFPKMVLLHMGPLPVIGSLARSFNFNKMRAMIIARIKVGVQLDADQFVAPGVDAIFDRTAEEITQEYPIPIMPSHFADRSPKDLGKYWDRYCPGDVHDLRRSCPWQTTRWGHAHPTWTYWALPFLGRWLRRNLRDETLPRRIRSELPELGEMSELRVTDVPEDEDLLNIGIWEEGGTKQWCKLDLAGPDDFDALLGGMDGENRCIHEPCTDVVGDTRFHPLGVAKAFYTAHHAVLPDTETVHYLRKLHDMETKGTLPPPIMFHGQFFKTGLDLQQAFPGATCLI